MIKAHPDGFLAALGGRHECTQNLNDHRSTTSKVRADDGLQSQ